jgi:hypothetical protein
MLNNKIPNERVIEIVTESVAIEKEFICEVGARLRRALRTHKGAPIDPQAPCSLKGPAGHARAME